MNRFRALIRERPVDAPKAKVGSQRSGSELGTTFDLPCWNAISELDKGFSTVEPLDLDKTNRVLRCDKDSRGNAIGSP